MTSMKTVGAYIIMVYLVGVNTGFISLCAYNMKMGDEIAKV